MFVHTQQGRSQRQFVLLMDFNLGKLHDPRHNLLTNSYSDQRLINGIACYLLVVVAFLSVKLLFVVYNFFF